MDYLLAVFLLVYLLQVAWDVWVDGLNLRYIKDNAQRVVHLFDGFIDAGTLKNISLYTQEKTRFGMFQEMVSEAVLLGLILTGVLVAFAHTLQESGLHYILSGLLFFFLPSLVMYAVELPFDYFHTFVLEEKFGFNKSTLRIWVTDQVKSAVLSLVLFSLFMGLIFWIVRNAPSTWWIWGFLTASVIQLLLAVLYPKLIAPLFNKFEPVQDELLSKKIHKLMEENGIRVKNILQMDAGLRSRHTNAYFAGIGRTKRIVLFDTLINSHPHDEVLSVLAHEIGHLKGRHILKQLLLFEASMLAGFYLTFRLTNWPELYQSLGVDGSQFYVGLFFLGIFGQKVGFFLQPVYMAMLRRFEREADLYAVNLLGTGKPLATALKRIAADNLSNLSPHPVYVYFNYSHPPIAERIRLIEAAENSTADRGTSLGERSGVGL